MKIGEYEQMMAYLTRPGFKDGTEKIVEPPKSMQVDTTTKNPMPDYDIRDFRNDAELYILALNNNTLPKDDIAFKLNSFAQKGIDAGTFTMQEAVDAVKDLKLYVKDRARQQRLRDVIPEGIGTIKREEFAEGSDRRLNETKLDEPYLYEYETPTGGKRYQAKVAGSGFSKAMRRAFPYTEEGKQQALETIKDFVSKYTAPEGIKKLKNPPNPNKPFRYKTYDKGAQYFATKEEAEEFKKSRLEGRTIKQTKLPKGDFDKIVNRIKKGETLKDIAKDYDLADTDRIRRLLKDNSVTYSQLTPNISSYTQDPDLRTSFIENYKKKSSTNLAKELFPEDNLSTALSKYATLRDTLKKENLIKVQPGYTDELKETFSKEPKAVQAKKIRARRDKLIKEVSDLDIERLLKEGKTGEGLDQAHRLSLKQVKKTGQLYNVLNLGIEAPDINREVIQSYEDSLTKLYNKQNKLVKEAKKFDNVPRDISLQLSDLNKQVSDIVAKTDGRLQGVHIDEFTLKPKTTGINYINTIGMGLIDKDIKKLTQADIDLAKAIMPYQIESERRLAPGAKADLLKNQRGVMLGSAGDLDTAARLIKEDFQTAKKLFGQYAPQIARSSIPAIKFMLAETGIGAALVPMDIAEGLTPKEIGLNLLTLGTGVPLKDIQERARFVEEKGLGSALESAFRKQMIPQTMRPAMGLPVDFGAPQELTEKEQLAKQMFETEAREPIESRRKKLAAERVEKYSDPMFGFREGAMNGGIMRLGFADGPSDPSKRKFMKIMGGLASLPILGKFIKPAAKVAEQAAPAVVETFKNAPPHFVGLVNKIRALGKIVEPEKLMPSDQKRYSNVYDYGDYRMFEGKDGQIEIAKDRFMATDYGDAKVSEEYMSYNPKSPKIKKGKLTGETEPEYDEYTAYADQDGKMKDVVNGVEPSTMDDGTFSKEELEQLIIEQVEKDLKKGKK